MIVFARGSITDPASLGPYIAEEMRTVFYEQTLGIERAANSPPHAVVFATQPIPFAVRDPLTGTDLDRGQPGLGVALWRASMTRRLSTTDSPRPAFRSSLNHSTAISDAHSPSVPRRLCPHGPRRQLIAFNRLGGMERPAPGT
jgi:hypothetical protein